MRAVEVRTRQGRPIALALPYPFPIQLATAEGVGVQRQAARSFGFRYLFVVARDVVRGWQVDEERPFFEAATPSLLAPYMTDVHELQDAWEGTLGSLAAAWLADVQWRWKSREATAPGERQLGAAFLGELRADEVATHAE